MSQFDKINDNKKEVISSSIENNNEKYESYPTQSSEELKAKEDRIGQNRILDQKRIDEIQKELVGENHIDLTNDVLSKMKSGEQIYLALKQNGDEDAINRRIESLTNEKASQLLSSIDMSYSYLINASDEEVKAIYLKYFESQTSNHYIGGLISAIDSESFKAGFFSAKNGVPVVITDRMNNIIKISERLLKAKNELSNREDKIVIKI